MQPFFWVLRKMVPSFHSFNYPLLKLLFGELSIATHVIPVGQIDKGQVHFARNAQIHSFYLCIMLLQGEIGIEEIWRALSGNVIHKELGPFHFNKESPF